MVISIVVVIIMIIIFSIIIVTSEVNYHISYISHSVYTCLLMCVCVCVCVFAYVCLCLRVCVYIRVVVRSNSCKNVVLRGCGRLRGLISYFLATD